MQRVSTSASAASQTTHNAMNPWPTDILVQFLHFLSVQCDVNAQQAWHQLAFLVCKRSELSDYARGLPQPMMLRIEIAQPPEEEEDESVAMAKFPEDDTSMFQIPFLKANVVCIDVHWGDGCVDRLREKGEGFVWHKYAAPGDYTVCVFPAQRNNNDGKESEVWLDHLGFSSRYIDQNATFGWWRSLRQILSFGTLGVRSLSYLFAGSGRDLKVDVQSLPTSEICDMSGMFCWSSFNQPLDNLNISKVTNMSHMFNGAREFDQTIAGWDVSSVTNMRYMFNDATSFNQPIGTWKVSNVTDMSYMFKAARSFNQPIGDWDVSNVADMRHMFESALRFNQLIGNWDVSRVTNLDHMFANAKTFNQPIGSWNVSNVTKMSYMFSDASKFNQPIGSWNVGNVVNMSYMFRNAVVFNQRVDAWNVSDQTLMAHMFFGALEFNQPIDKWQHRFKQSLSMSRARID
jgi:surface protein